MRNAFDKEVVRSIARSWTRFLAVFAIVALGAGFYAGLRMCAPDMRTTVDRYLDGTAFMDAHLISTLGFSDADVRAVRDVPGVAAVMPSHVVDGTADVGDSSVTVRVHSLDADAARASDTSDGAHAYSKDADYLNRPILIAGRWPERSGECVIDNSKLFANANRLGQKVTLTGGAAPLTDTFTRTDFTVVGVVNSSYYLRFTRGTTTMGDGSIDRVLFVPEQDFTNPHTYTDVFLTVKGAAALSTFSGAYNDTIKPVALALEKLAPKRAAARLAEVQAEARSTLDEKRAEYDKARADADAQLAGGQAQLDSAAADIAAARSRLDAGERRYDQGVRQLASQRAQLEQLGAALPAIQQQVAALQAQVASLQAAYEQALAEEALGNPASPSSAELAVPLGQAQAALSQAQSAYAQQRAAYESGSAQVVQAQGQLDATSRELRKGRTDLASAERALAESQASFDAQRADANTQLADSLKAIEDAQAKIDAMKLPDWYVLGRRTNLGYASVADDASRIQAISFVFPLIFFLVAALVALTTMTRMVDEERTLIGTYKALGYGNARIAAKYLVYAGIASVAGSVLGIVIGSQVLPETVWNAYTTVYTAPAIAKPVDVPLALVAALASVAITAVATFAAAEATLREGPATLMLPRAPRPGKRIFLERIKPLWSRLSFSRKVTARNLFRYKKRLLMTVVGIAGCTALLLTGFGLRNSINDILDIQYSQISHYNMIVGFEPGALEATGTPQAPTLRQVLSDRAIFSDELAVRVEGMQITNAADPPAARDSARGGTAAPTGFGLEKQDEQSMHGYICVPSEPRRFNGFVTLRDRRTKDPVPLDDSGAVVTEKLARKLGLKVGDKVRLERLDDNGNAVAGSAIVFPVSGITEQYVAHYVYATPALYERTTGSAPAYNEALAMATASGSTARERLSRFLLGITGVRTVQFNQDITASFDDMLKSLDSVVFILIFSAGALAFIVLYNLTNINVTERVREVATIKVLGFFDSEVNAYIYRETAALAVLGCVFGLAAGIGLEAFVISTVEIELVMFGRTIHPMSYVYSAALTLAFALVVNLAMAPRLKRIDMVESLKSVE